MQKGWRGASEVNRVVYDPRQVTVEQMEDWLRQSGTYIRTVPGAHPGDTNGEE
ncbi:hypothetical protein [Desulfuromonas sp.]|uniref:hypothetical protein n=1 Tax=Desulfuromonas sp. TaxID=892 RepID=UPI0025BE0578|nr:hypothetical protein [Desulfuromonas sp.]